MDYKYFYDSNEVCNIIKQTPLEFNQYLSTKYNCNIFFKREDLQSVRSFKIRGAFNKIINSNTDNGVVCASAGNHAQGVALTCNKLSIHCTIFVPETTPTQKIERIKNFNKKAELYIIGSTFDKCLIHARKFSQDNNKIFIHPFDDEYIINGQSSICNEIFEKIQPTKIICPIGGGGLIAGMVKYITENNFKTEIIGSEPENADSMRLSLMNKKITKIKTIDTFVDGAAVSEIGQLNFDICKNKVKQVYAISNGELCTQLVRLHQEDGIIAEPAGVLSVCALKYLKNIKSSDNIVCIISGGNNDITRYQEIIERSMIYKKLKHYFLVEFKQKAGELKRFVLNILDDTIDITRFEYIKKSNKDFGSVLIGVELINTSIKIESFMNRMTKLGFKYKYINDQDIIYSTFI